MEPVAVKPEDWLSCEYNKETGEVVCADIKFKKKVVFKEIPVVPGKVIELFKKSFLLERPPFLVGRYGIGKSRIVRHYAEKVAQQKGKKFVLYHKICSYKDIPGDSCLDKISHILNHPEDYYVFVDIKLQQYSPEEVKGVMILDKNNNVRIKPPLWAQILSKADGLLFLDEITTADPSLAATAFELVLDKKLGEISLRDDVEIVLAGNRMSESAAAEEVPEPLINRSVVIDANKILDYKSWREWAEANRVHPFIQVFVATNPELYFWQPAGSADVVPGTSPRSWEAVDRLLKLNEAIHGVVQLTEEDKRIIRGLLSPEVAETFLSSIESAMKYYTDLETYLDPEKFNELKPLDKYTVAYLAASRAWGLMEEGKGDKAKEYISKLFYLAGSNGDVVRSAVIYALPTDKSKQAEFVTTIVKVFNSLPQEVKDAVSPILYKIQSASELLG